MGCSLCTLGLGCHLKVNAYLSASEDSKLDWTDDKDEPEEETARNKDIETEAKRETRQQKEGEEKAEDQLQDQSQNEMEKSIKKLMSLQTDQVIHT